MKKTIREFFKETHPDVYNSVAENSKDFTLRDVLLFAYQYHQAKLKSNVIPDVIESVCEHTWISGRISNKVEVCIFCDKSRIKQTVL